MLKSVALSNRATRGPRQYLTRSLWALVDQVVVSSRSPVLLLIVATTAKAGDFAAVTLWFTSVQLLAGAFVFIVVDQGLVRVGQVHIGPRTTLVIATACALLIVASAAVSMHVGLLLMTALPFLLLVEAERANAFVRGISLRLILGDSMPPVGAALGAFTTMSVTWTLVGFLVGTVANAALLWDPKLFGIPAQPLDLRTSCAFATDYLASVGYGQVVVLAVATFSAPTTGATLRLAQSLFALPGVAATGLRLVLLPHLAKNSLSALRYITLVLMLAGIGVVGSAAAIVVGTLVLSGADPRIATLFSAIAIPMAIQTVLVCMVIAAPMILKGSSQNRRLVQSRLLIVLISSAGVALGVSIDSVTGAAWGLMAGSSAAFVIWNYQTVKVLPRTRQEKLL